MNYLLVIIGFFNFQFLVTHVTTAITCVTRIFKGYPRLIGKSVKTLATHVIAVVTCVTRNWKLKNPIINHKRKL